jgi:hypothetical protein
VNKIFINKIALPSASPTPAVRAKSEGLYTAGGELVLASGEDFEGYYHYHDNDIIMAGFTHDPQDPDSLLHSPTPRDQRWLSVLNKKQDTQVRTSESVVPVLSSDIIKRAEDQMLNTFSLDENDYVITSISLFGEDVFYRSVFGFIFYSYVRGTTTNTYSSVGDKKLTPTLQEEFDQRIVSFIKNKYGRFLSDDTISLLSAEVPSAEKIMAISKEPSIGIISFNNNIVLQQGDIYALYDYEISKVSFSRTQLKVNLSLSDSILNSINPQIVYKVIDNEDELKKYFSLRDKSEFNEKFGKTDFYNTVQCINMGYPTYNKILSQNIKNKKMELSFKNVDTSKDLSLMVALVAENNIFVFYNKLVSSGEYLYPTVDSLDHTQITHQQLIRQYDLKIPDFSKLYYSCDVGSEKRQATMFFGFNIQNRLQNLIKFPGAFRIGEVEKYVSNARLIQKTISKHNRQQVSTNINMSYFSETKDVPLRINNLKSITEEKAIVYFFGNGDLQKGDKYQCSFSALISDYSVEIGKRFIRKCFSMNSWLNQAFSDNPQTPFDIKSLSSLVVDLGVFYQGAMPAGCEYLNKVTKNNFALSRENVEMIKIKLSNIALDIKNKIGINNFSLFVSKQAFSTPKGVFKIDHDFSTIISFEKKKENPLKISSDLSQNIGAISINDLTAAVFNNVYSEKKITVEVVDAIPEMVKSYRKKYSYDFESALKKFAPNYNLDGCTEPLGLGIPLDKPTEILVYDRQAQETTVQILNSHEHVISLAPAINHANYFSVSAPIFENLDKYYDVSTGLYSLSSGQYLARMQAGDNYYNDYFILTV